MPGGIDGAHSPAGHTAEQLVGAKKETAESCLPQFLGVPFGDEVSFQQPFAELIGRNAEIGIDMKLVSRKKRVKVSVGTRRRGCGKARRRGPSATEEKRNL
jgi:hypothetical protein